MAVWVSSGKRQWNGQSQLGTIVSQISMLMRRSLTSHADVAQSAYLPSNNVWVP